MLIHERCVGHVLRQVPATSSTGPMYTLDGKSAAVVGLTELPSRTVQAPRWTLAPDGITPNPTCNQHCDSLSSTSSSNSACACTSLPQRLPPLSLFAVGLPIMLAMP